MFYRHLLLIIAPDIDLRTQQTLNKCFPNLDELNFFFLSRENKMNILVTDNGSEVAAFILVDLSNHLKPQIAFYCTVVVVYMITLMDNNLIIILVRDDEWLHTTMCFFLSKLPFLNICYSSNSVFFLVQWFKRPLPFPLLAVRFR